MRRIPPHLRLAFLHFIVDVIEEAEARKNNPRRAWTTEDKRKLIELRQAGAKWTDIAAELNRTTQAARKEYELLIKEAV